MDRGCDVKRSAQSRSLCLKMAESYVEKLLLEYRLFEKIRKK